MGGTHTEGTPLGASLAPWSFFYVRSAPGLKEFPVAVHSSGVLVVADESSGWFEFLSTPQDVAHLHNQIAWLYGQWTTLSPSSRSSRMIFEEHPNAAAHVTEPQKVLVEDTIHFSGWFFTPPYGPIFQFEIVSSERDRTTFRMTPLAEILEGP